MNFTVLQKPTSTLLMLFPIFFKPNPPTNIVTNDTILIQYSIKQMLKVFGNKGEAEVKKEL